MAVQQHKHLRRRALKRRVSQALFVVLPVLVFIYIFKQLLDGERGYFVWLDMNQQVEELTLENAILQEEKQRLEEAVSRLQAHQIDEDFVDELIRRNLPYLQPEDELIFLKD